MFDWPLVCFRQSSSVISKLTRSQSDEATSPPTITVDSIQQSKSSLNLGDDRKSLTHLNKRSIDLKKSASKKSTDLSKKSTDNQPVSNTAVVEESDQVKAVKQERLDVRPGSGLGMSDDESMMQQIHNLNIKLVSSTLYVSIGTMYL